jgi:hypothetical protein
VNIWIKNLTELYGHYWESKPPPAEDMPRKKMKSSPTRPQTQQISLRGVIDIPPAHEDNDSHPTIRKKLNDLTALILSSGDARGSYWGHATNISGACMIEAALHKPVDTLSVRKSRRKKTTKERTDCQLTKFLQCNSSNPFLNGKPTYTCHLTNTFQQYYSH